MWSLKQASIWTASLLTPQDPLCFSWVPACPQALHPWYAFWTEDPGEPGVASRLVRLGAPLAEVVSLLYVAVSQLFSWRHCTVAVVPRVALMSVVGVFLQCQNSGQHERSLRRVAEVHCQMSQQL